MIGYQEIRCHVIFNEKMDSSTRKARFVAGRHTTDTPGSTTHPSVVLCDSVSTGISQCQLNDLDELARDVTKAYLNAKCRKF